VWRAAEASTGARSGRCARVLELGRWGIRAVRWEELDIVGHWREFLREPDSYFRHLLDR